MTRWKALLLRLALTDWKTILTGVVLVAVVVVGAFTGALFGVSIQPSQLTIINGTAKVVSEARLSQGERVLAVTTIGPSQVRSVDFVPRNGSLTLVARFASGRSVSVDDVGYLVAGDPVIVTFEVSDNNVALLTITRRRIGRRL